jgi:asparagine synthase (glutamine-hydrolysing)
VCGLAGLVFADLERLAKAEDILMMVQSLAHRGPDDQGIECLGPAALGHRRLSIIDLSSAGRQPLCNEDGSVWLVCNGEIYNHRELRVDLEKRGHVFSSQSDSEVIVHLYEEYGPSFVSRLRGMFAFAVWDCKAQRLLLARDRLGQKPLFYREQKDSFAFASEALALHKGSTDKLTLNREALIEYLTLGYIPSPNCAFAGSKKLPPAHYLIKEMGQAAVIKRYWSLNYGPKWSANTATGRARLDEQFLTLFDEAVSLREMSDVPLGAFLSGGIDSSAIVSAMTQQRPRSFSIGFASRSYDERRYARMVASRYRTRHHELKVEAEDVTSVLIKLIDRFGEPFADSSAIPCYYLAQMARKKVSVALSGDGSDELFGGYLQFVANDLASSFDRLPKLLRQGLLPRLVEALPIRLGRDDPIFRLKRFMNGFMNKDSRRRPLLWSCLMQRPQLDSLLNDDLAQSLQHLDPLASPLGHGQSLSDDSNDRALHMALSCYLPDDLLTKVDITSMAHGLETRAPFLDHKLVEFVARLPMTQKVCHGQTKRLLKRSLLGRLPRSLLYRSKKGFAVPIDRWFRGPLRSFLRDTVLSKQARSRGIFRAERVEKMIVEHEKGHWNHQHRLWALLCLELWFQSCERHLPAFQGSV